MTPKQLAKQLANKLYNEAAYYNVAYKVKEASKKAKEQCLQDVNNKLDVHFKGRNYDFWLAVKDEIELL